MVEPVCGVSHLWVPKLVLESVGSASIHRLGEKHDETIVPAQMEGRRVVGQPLHKDHKDCRRMCHSCQKSLPKVCGECEQRPSAESKWREVRIGGNVNALNILVGPCNHTRWKHKWGWHYRGCVWDPVASGRAGDEDWTEKGNNARATWR